MDAATDEELRRLRARAYGPASDIHQDPAAVRRLQELEALRHRRAAAGPESPSDAGRSVPRPEVEASATPQNDQTLTELGLMSAATIDSEAGSSAPSEPVPRRRTGSWVLAVMASAALAAGVTAAATWIIPVRVSAGASQVATLDPTPRLEVPAGWLGAVPDAAVFEFYGLTLFESEYSPNAGSFEGGDRCLSLVTADQVPAPEDFDVSSWSFSGEVFSDCSVGAFPATVEIPIDAESPDSLRARYPEGTAVQFVLDGDRIGVFLDKS